MSFIHTGDYIVPWLVRHTSGVMNRFMVKSDGKTGYERWKGKKFRGVCAEFGEKVMYLKSGSLHKDKFFQDGRLDSGKVGETKQVRAS